MAFASCIDLTAQSWSLLGNSGTVDGTNFMGTTDPVPLNFRVNNQQAGRIEPYNECTIFGLMAAPLTNSSSYAISAFGAKALYNNTTGYGNSAFGNWSLSGNTTGSYNTAIGAIAMYGASGWDNTAVGAYALSLNTSGSYNTATGVASMAGNSTGSYNTAYGVYSLNVANTSWNTAIGYRSLLYGGPMGDNNTALGALTSLGANYITNALALGYSAIVNANNKCRIGDASMGITECQNGVYAVSDGRFKNKINENEVKGLEFIKLLRPVVYNFDTKSFTEFLTKNMPDSVKKNYMNKDFEPSSSVRQTGFIAQEVEQAAEKSGFNFSGLHKPVDENDNYSINYGQFVVPLVKGMQEQQQVIEEQQQQIRNLMKRIEALETKGSDKIVVGTGIEQLNSMQGFRMDQNEPNPFTHETVVRYNLPQQINNAYMAVYDLSGKQITSLPITQKGQALVTITSEKLAAGIYIYSIVADGKIVDSKRMIVAEK